MIKCVNSQPVSVISNRCWSGIRGTLTKILKKFGIPCTHDDLYRACWRHSQEVYSLAQRPQTSARRGQVNNPKYPMMMGLYLTGNLGHALGM